MTVDNTLCFADFDVVTGAPSMDGYTGIHDDFVITSEFDAGYVRGCRLTYGSGSAFPPVIFNGVKNGNFLNFAFFCRLDYSFDLQDVLVLALRPQVSNPDQSTARRIDIFPVYEAVGADDKNVMTGGPLGQPDSVVPGVPMGVDYHIRTGHIAQNVVHYRGQAAGAPWTTINLEDMSTYDPSANITVRTRSWLPPVPTQTNSVGAQMLPTATFNVLNTAAFAPAGVFAVNGQLVRYTGKTGTSFTGCTGGAGAVGAGLGVSIPEVGWSIEVQLPLTIAAAGGAGTRWIDIQDSFGLYFTVIRVGKTPVSGGTGSQGWYSTQFTFPANTGNYLTGSLNETTIINPAWYGTGLIPALQMPPGSNLGLGVHFANDAWSAGVRDTTAAAFSPIGGLIRSAAVAGPDNRLVAQVANTGPDANGVKAEFRFANWGLPPATFPSWALAAGATADQPAGVLVPATGATTEITFTWPKAAVGSTYNPPNDHQCVWVQLNAAGVNFNQSSVRRNMDIDHLSELDRPATISGVGYPVPASGSHDFLLMTFVRRFEQFGREGNLASFGTASAAAPKGTVYWLWIVHGYRRTGKTITINKQEFEVLDESPGAFGSLCPHQGQGTDDIFSYELSGGGIKHLGGYFHALKVPHNSSVTINTRIAAGPAGSFGPVVKPGCLMAFIAWLKGLFGKTKP